jgi:hypothetical protein
MERRSHRKNGSVGGGQYVFAEDSGGFDTENLSKGKEGEEAHDGFGERNIIKAS